MFTVTAVINEQTLATLRPVVQDIARQMAAGLPGLVDQAARGGITVEQIAWGKVIQVAAMVVESDELAVDMLSPLGVTTYGAPS